MQRDRSALVKKLQDLTNEQIAVRKEIELLDSQNNISKYDNIVGRCYLDNRNYNNSNYINCIYVYGIDDNLTLTSLSISYYKDSNTYYEIEYSDTFDPIKYNEDLTQWVQIPKTVFDAHYNNIMNIISNIMDK